MKSYTAYMIGDDGHFHDFMAIIATDDDAAVVQAQHLVDGHAVEVWQFDRKVAVLPSKE